MGGSERACRGEDLLRQRLHPWRRIAGKLLRGGADDGALLEALGAAIAAKPKRHGFLEEVGDREVRRMNEIGG